MIQAINIDAIQVRASHCDDRDRIPAVHHDAFGDDEGPVIVSLVEEMLDDPTAEPIDSFVAELEKTIVGHVLFTSIKIEPANASTSNVFAQILAPLAVAGDLHREGIGTRLAKDALQQLAAACVELVFVLGYPKYYSRFGFAAAGVRGFQAPYPIPQKNADASITARPFFERMGFSVVREQLVECRGVQLTNFRMRRAMQADAN